MKKLLSFVAILFIGLALLAASLAMPGKAWASALESGVLQVITRRSFLPLVMPNSMAHTAVSLTQPVDCGLRPTHRNLVTSQGTVVGEVSMHHDSQFLYVEITAASGQCFSAIQLHVATDLSGIPQVDGVPVPAQFEHNVTLSDCVTSYTFVLPMEVEWKEVDSLVVAIHVESTEQQAGAKLSAWGDCEPFPGDASAKYCTYLKSPAKVLQYNVSVGYEDLDLTSSHMDFDYNDWVTDIAGDLRYCRTIDQGNVLWQLDLTVTPQARGAGLDHAYHIDIPANVFPSDGTATLVRYDQNGSVIGVPLEVPFIADQINQFDLVDPTSAALPGSIVNTRETSPHQETLGTARLRIEFDDPFFFDIDPYLPALEGNEHGERLFFQPHLSVYMNPVYEIRPGSPLMLVVPFLTWRWPEERVPIWTAYPDVIPGDLGTNPKVPPEFPVNWYDDFNNCVYDGVPCTPALSSINASAATLEPYPAP